MEAIPVDLERHSLTSPPEYWLKERIGPKLIKSPVCSYLFQASLHVETPPLRKTLQKARLIRRPEQSYAALAFLLLEIHSHLSEAYRNTN